LRNSGRRGPAARIRSPDELLQFIARHEIYIPARFRAFLDYGGICQDFREGHAQILDPVCWNTGRRNLVAKEFFASRRL